jgi:uncharacterized membrane protein YdjX (TVP38/TMEM64 family)
VIGPALVLAAIVGLFHVSAYVFIRGTAGSRLPLLLLAAFLGAWAGDAIGARLDADPLRIGDFHVIAASIVAWIGIGLVALLAVLVPDRVASTPVRPATSARQPEAARPPEPGVPT